MGFAVAFAHRKKLAKKNQLATVKKARANWWHNNMPLSWSLWTDGAVTVAQLVDLPYSTPEICSSNPVIADVYKNKKELWIAY